MKFQKSDILYLTIILFLGFVVLFRGCNNKIETPLPAKKQTSMDNIKKYKDSIDILNNKINVTNININRLYSDLDDIKKQKDAVISKYKADIDKLRSIVPDECDTVFVTYDEMIDSLENVHFWEVKNLKGIIQLKDSVINYQGEIINNHSNIESEQNKIILFQKQEYKDLKKKKNKTIVKTGILSFLLGGITGLLIK